MTPRAAVTSPACAYPQMRVFHVRGSGLYAAAFISCSVCLVCVRACVCVCVCVFNSSEVHAFCTMNTDYPNDSSPTPIRPHLVRAARPLHVP